MAPSNAEHRLSLHSSSPDDETQYTLDDELEREQEEIVREVETSQSRRTTARVQVVRVLALLCACSLSVGSHYASYILGPLKSRLSRELGTSNTEFSLLISAFSLNSTWTPLVGGLLASRFGTTTTSIIATSLIFLGQAILLLGDIFGSVRLMTFGMFIFGLGVSPLSVVQESIIVRFFKNHGLGLSMAFGLVAGKISSFISARTSYPLSERFGPRAPFYAATILAGLSFAMNLVYLSASKWLVKGTGTELESSELDEEARSRQVDSMSEAQALKQVAEKRRVHFRDITKLGDIFWAYIGINILCGTIWHPFTHLAAGIFEKRYDLSERDAGTDASYLLAGSAFLYPICGYIIDRLKKGPILHVLLILSSVLTLFCYFWLSLPPTATHGPFPAIISCGIGLGFSPLVLVILVPTLVPSKYIPTTLGAHKSLEQTGSTIFQTLAGLILDRTRTVRAGAEPGQSSANEKRAIQLLLFFFLFLNACQLFGVLGLWSMVTTRKRQAAWTPIRSPSSSGPQDEEDEPEPERPTQRRRLSLARKPVQESHSLQQRESIVGEASVHARQELTESSSLSSREEEQPLLGGQDPATAPTASQHERIPSQDQGPILSQVGLARTKAELRRGEIFAGICAGAIACAWLLFIGTALVRLRSKKEREGGI